MFLLAMAIAGATLGGAQITFNGIELPWPTRELEWKEINVLSISDSHGWLLGHQHSTWPEPNYSGNYGDLASFITHMRRLADDKGADLLVVDAGDHHDGSGLVSSSKDGATLTDEIFAKIDYDVLTIGNHELYDYEPAKEAYDNAGRYNGRYLTSNIDITVEENGKLVSRPIGRQFAKFQTKHGRQVTAFGTIFNFQAHGPNLTIQSPSLMVSQPWFLKAIDQPPDYFILVGHMPLRADPSAQWHPVFKAIRKRHPYVPILIFGGHDHTRDCKQFDDHSIAVVPGRYLETVAFTSSSLPDPETPSTPLNMARRYLDANRNTYMYHSQTDLSTFDTSLGKSITRSLLELASSLNISQSLGTAPDDLFLSRYPAGHPNHVNTVWTDQVIPTILKDDERTGKRVVISNSGSLRFNVFRGEFNRNDELTLSPFSSEFLYIPMKAGFARNILTQMNQNGATKLVPSSSGFTNEEEEMVEEIYSNYLREQWTLVAKGEALEYHDQVVLGPSRQGPTMGYVTRDSCPGHGDDIEHVPVPHSDLQVDFISSPFPEAEDDEMIDVVVMDFTQDDFFIAVKMLDPLYDLRPRDMRSYAKGIKLNAMWGMYAQQAWQ